MMTTRKSEDDPLFEEEELVVVLVETPQGDGASNLATGIVGRAWPLGLRETIDRGIRGIHRGVPRNHVGLAVVLVTPALGLGVENNGPLFIFGGEVR